MPLNFLGSTNPTYFPYLLVDKGDYRRDAWNSGVFMPDIQMAIAFEFKSSK